MVWTCNIWTKPMVVSRASSMHNSSTCKPHMGVKLVVLTTKVTPKTITMFFSRRGQLRKFIGVVGAILIMRLYRLRKLIRHRVKKLMEAQYLANLQPTLTLVCRLEKGFQKEQLMEWANLPRKWKLMEVIRKTTVKAWQLAIGKFKDQQKGQKETTINSSQIRAWTNPKTNSK